MCTGARCRCAVVCGELVVLVSAVCECQQCSTFTGMIPVFGVLLILFEWYWYVVCESGMRVIDSCSGQPLELLGCYIALEAAESTESRLSPVSLDSVWTQWTHF